MYMLILWVLTLIVCTCTYDSNSFHCRLLWLFIWLFLFFVFPSRNFTFEIYMNEKQFLGSEEHFVSSFLTKSRKHYGCLLLPKHTSTPSKKYLFEASVNHTVAGFVEEVNSMHDIYCCRITVTVFVIIFHLAMQGIEFLDTVWLISTQRQWNSDALKEECRQWFSLLLKAVEIKKGVESILRTLLSSSKAVTVAKDCRPHIEAEVCVYIAVPSIYYVWWCCCRQTAKSSSATYNHLNIRNRFTESYTYYLLHWKLQQLIEYILQQAFTRLAPYIWVI